MIEVPSVEDWVAIYTLSAPGSKKVRYVGATKMPLKRLVGHMKDSGIDTPKGQWIQSLGGAVPVMTVVELCHPWHRRVRERAWIEAFGSSLVNHVVARRRVPPPPSVLVAARLSLEEMKRLKSLTKRAVRDLKKYHGVSTVATLLIRRGMEAAEREANFFRKL